MEPDQAIKLQVINVTAFDIGFTSIACNDIIDNGTNRRTVKSEVKLAQENRPTFKNKIQVSFS